MINVIPKVFSLSFGPILFSGAGAVWVIDAFGFRAAKAGRKFIIKRLKPEGCVD